MAATSTTRFVVCGAGSIGREYALRHLTSENGARVVAIVDPSAQAAADLAQAAASQQAAGASAVVGSKYREQVIGGEGAQTAQPPHSVACSHVQILHQALHCCRSAWTSHLFHIYLTGLL